MRSHKTSLLLLVALAACLTAASPLAAQSPSAEDKLLDVLKSAAPADQKCNACRELRTAGTEKSIPVLAALLLDAETSHSARIALEAMPYPSAAAALREAAGKATGLTKSGILDSLGERRDRDAVPLLTKNLEDQDPQVVAAAAVALGKIGTAAARSLSAARAKTQGELRAKIGDGLLLAADRLLKAGNRDEAAAIFRELSQASESKRIRAGALRGVMQTSGSETVPAVIKALASDDAQLRSAAAGHLPNLSAAEFMAIAQGTSRLPTASQASILMAIRVRGDKSFAPLALEAVKSGDETVRVMAVRALGTAGDAAALPVLVELAAGKDKTADAARQSLEAICGPQIDQGIIAALRAEKDPTRRAGWIAVVETRRPEGAVEVLLAEATHQDSAVRSRALNALAKLASPRDIPLLVAVVLKTEKGPQRDEAERTVKLVCGQIPDSQKQADPVLEILRAAGDADRVELLPLVGRLGGPQARQIIQQAMDTKSGPLCEAGTRALCNWPDASVAPQLLQLVQGTSSETHRTWALRAFIRVATLPGGAEDADKLASLKQSVQLAMREEDRAYVVERASAVRTVETLRFLLPYLDQPAFAETACKSIVELARHKELLAPNKSEFGPALEKVLKISKDPATAEKARRFRAE